jgi:TDG/mug DNA glycosylase family protein
MSTPDYLRPGLDLVIVGINPGVASGAARRNYAGPGNHFWPLLFESGLVTEPITWREDERVLEWNIGLTNMVPRTTRSLTDLTPSELKAGAETLRKKLTRYRPAVACFNGKRIFEVFAGRTASFGVQPETVGGAIIYVMPSTSARTAAYQRPDKLRHFIALRDLVRETVAARRAAVRKVAAS